MKLDFVDNEWIKKYCDMEIESETERWENLGRPKNDPYVNGSHAGHTHALQHLKKFIEMLERLEEKKQSGEKK